MIPQIYYLLYSSSVHPALSAGSIPPEVLTPVERTVYNSFKSDKRRHEWVLGRWTGKRLIQAVLGIGIRGDEIEILAREDGSPEVQFQQSAGRSPLPEMTLSISHSHGSAFCGVVEGKEVSLGVDLERVEMQTVNVVREYFVQDELASLETASRERRAEIVTAIWSAKEAALKAIRVGLLADPLAVKCLPEGKGTDWSPIYFEWDFTRLKRTAPSLSGWWRRWGDFVLTMAVSKQSDDFQEPPQNAE